MEMCCRDCYFRKAGTLECHRRAPVATGGMMSEEKTIWPSITENNFCGEFLAFPYDTREN